MTADATIAMIVETATTEAIVLTVLIVVEIVIGSSPRAALLAAGPQCRHRLIPLPTLQHPPRNTTRLRKNGPLQQPKLLARPPSPLQIWVTKAGKVAKETAIRLAGNATVAGIVTALNAVTVPTDLTAPIDQKVPLLALKVELSRERSVDPDLIGSNVDPVRSALKAKLAQIAPTVLIVDLVQTALSVANVPLVVTDQTVQNATVTVPARVVKADRVASSRADSISPMEMALASVKVEDAISVAVARIVTAWLPPSVTGPLTASARITRAN
jgi:hypothetical protein